MKSRCEYIFSLCPKNNLPGYFDRCSMEELRLRNRVCIELDEHSMNSMLDIVRLELAGYQRQKGLWYFLV